MSFRGLVNAHVIGGGGGAIRDAGKEVTVRVSMGRLHGLRLGMSHQNDAAQKEAAASWDVGGRRKGGLLESPGLKGEGRPPVCDLRERLSCSTLTARVPTAFDGIQQRFKVGFAMPVVDLAGRSDVIAEKLRRNNEVGAVTPDMAVKGLFDADRMVPGFDVDFAQERAARLIRITLDLSHAKRRVAAVAELDHREIGKRERENINLAWF